MLNPGVLDALLQNNDSVCGHENPRAFKKLRVLLMAGSVVKERSVDRLGPMETKALFEAIGSSSSSTRAWLTKNRRGNGHERKTCGR